MTLHYDRMGTRCSGHPQPGTGALHTAVEDRWPFLRPAGIYNCRPVRGGATLSAHGEGRATDEGIGTSDLRGWEVARTMVAKADELGIQCVIWDRQIWSVLSPYWHAYGGQDPHTQHLHIEQNWDGALHLTVSQALRILQVGPTSPGGFLMALTDQQQEAIFGAVGRMESRLEAVFGAVARFDQVEIPEIDAALAAIKEELAKAREPQDPVAFAQAVKEAFGTDVAKDFAKAFAEIVKAGAGG